MILNIGCRVHTTSSISQNAHAEVADDVLLSPSVPLTSIQGQSPVWSLSLFSRTLPPNMLTSTEIIIFYKYVRISDPVAFVAWQRATCEELGLRGRILIAEEGINGTLEGPTESIAEYESRMHGRPEFSDLWFKSSPGTGEAFKKLIVKLRSEIVATGLPKGCDIDPNVVTGKHIGPEELKRWIENGEDFEIIDMRNDYEYAVGHFANSRNSTMANFRDLPKIAAKFEGLKKKKVLTVCTYGVRCEKASGFLKQEGFEDVYQLHGGIGTYMKQFPGEDFLGSLYVFDGRMTEQFTSKYMVIGECTACGSKTERFGNCAWHDCHKQLLICFNCAKHEKGIWCNDDCMVGAASGVPVR